MRRLPEAFERPAKRGRSIRRISSADPKTGFGPASNRLGRHSRSARERKEQEKEFLVSAHHIVGCDCASLWPHRFHSLPSACFSTRDDGTADKSRSGTRINARPASIDRGWASLVEASSVSHGRAGGCYSRCRTLDGS